MNTRQLFVKCSGKGCKVCEMTGWIPEYLKGTL